MKYFDMVFSNRTIGKYNSMRYNIVQTQKEETLTSLLRQTCLSIYNGRATLRLRCGMSSASFSRV